MRSITPDLVVLDLGLPGIDGLDVARQLRRASSVPIIMLTARSDEADRVAGLELGADDYVVKPFSPRSCWPGSARCCDEARRRTSGADGPLVVGDLIVDPARRRVTVGAEVVELTATEFDLLALMAAAPGRVFTPWTAARGASRGRRGSRASGRSMPTSRTSGARSSPTTDAPDGC